MSEFATVSLLDHCLSDLNTVKDFNNLNKVINFYHFHRCSENNCRYCSFARGLNTISEELEKEKSEDVTRLKFYCIMGKEIFITSRIYIHKPADTEKKGLLLEKEFQKVFIMEQKKKDTIPSRHLNLSQ